MGAWGHGMQANDTAMDFISYYENGVPKEDIRKVLEKALEYDVYKGKPSEQLGTGNNWSASLGVAFLMDQGHDLSEHYEFLKPYIDDEKDVEVRGWDEPAKRIEALEVFEQRIKGHQFDQIKHAEQNKGLFQRIYEDLD